MAPPDRRRSRHGAGERGAPAASAPPAAPFNLGLIVLRALLVLGGCVLTWISVGLTSGLMGVQSSCAAPLGFACTVAESNAQAAALDAKSYVEGISNPQPRLLAAARQAATQALAREPGNVAAVRTLGLLASISNDQRRGEQWFSYSQALSRRDQPTQLWLIERRVALGDIAGALVHYDRALRVSQVSRDLLLPTLARAADDQAIVRPLARIVARRPNWWTNLVDAMVHEGQSPASLAIVARALRLDAAQPGDRWWLGGILDRLVDRGAYAQAFAVYQDASHRPTTALVRSPAFATGGVGPFEWKIASDADLSGVVQRRPQSDQLALSLSSAANASGVIARQMLLLPPGRYRLVLEAGSISGDVAEHPVVALSCARGSNTATELAGVVLPALADTGGRLARDVVVPGGCPAQWLSVTVRPRNFTQQDVEPWIGFIDVKQQ